MSHTRRNALPCLALTAALALPAVAHAGLEALLRISGKKVVVKDNANPAKRKAMFTSKDPALSFTGANAPTQSGMYVRFQGACLGSSAFYLPTTRWIQKNGKFKYKDKDNVDGPVKSVLAKAGSVKIQVKGAQFDYPLIGTGPQLRMSVAVETQEMSWTAFFGPDNATIKKDDSTKGVFSASNATAAMALPSSCLGAFVD